MKTIDAIKELETPETPLFLVDCTLTSGEVFHWSTHNVAANGSTYTARILKHNLFELRSSSTEATDGISRVSLTLANADSFLSPVERTTGWKGAQVAIRFLFFDLLNAAPASETQVLFRGTANPPDQSTESYLMLSFTNRLSLQRVFLPEVRIQKRCPWTFPASPDQQLEAVDGGTQGAFSPFYRCGYSAGVTKGVGNLKDSQAYTSCDYTRGQCEQRGMFNTDSGGNATGRFGGIEFVPSSILVRSYGAKTSQLSMILDNQARYNDFVPLIYGTGWYMPPIVFARNDGNLTRTEVLLGVGPITAAVKVIVNSIEIPEGVAGANMTASGWYNMVTPGSRNGAFNADFLDGTGKPLGDPYGSMAYLSVVVPNRISDGKSLPEIEVLVQGLQLSTFDAAGDFVQSKFTNNPAWVLLDVLRRSGWELDELDLASYAAVADRCDQPVPALDLNGNPTLVPRFQCNLLLTDKLSAGDIVRGIRTGASLYLTFNSTGLLQVTGEDTIAQQQASKPDGSNSTETLNGGWPAYEFGDNAWSGIARASSGQSSFRTSAKATADSPNVFTVEFQDEFNEFQQDSLTLVEVEDKLRANQQVAGALNALGIPNFDQANRVAALQLYKSVYGNMFVDFETSVRAINLRPGDLITVTYAKEGWDRQLFRVTRIAPGDNYRTAAITAQIHDDAWYEPPGQGSTGVGRQAGVGVRLPRPLLGTVVDDNGNDQFGITEQTISSTDGSSSIQLSVAFINPVKVISSGNGVPLLGLNPQIQTTGGTLPGGQNLYYGVTAVDSSSTESALSFVVKAAIPAGTATNQVTLPTLSLPPNTTGFDVYRGNTPGQLLQIAANLAIASQYTDIGAIPTQSGPPDANYDHANVYWRLELQPEEKVDIHSALTIGNSTLEMPSNEFTGAMVRILTGTGARQEALVVGNDTTSLTIGAPWGVEPDGTSTFAVSDSTWQFGATGISSPITFDVPNREGVTIQVSGRSANVFNEECSYELCPLTRWQILGDSGTLLDSDSPPAPTFGLSVIGQGSIEIQGISFSTFENTRSIAAGTLTVGFWNELNTPSLFVLSASIDKTASALTLQSPAAAGIGDLLQIEAEIMTVQVAAQGSSALTVTRETYGSSASTHAAGVPVYLLERKTFVLAFARQFFGSPASGNYSFPIFLPDVRLGTAELFMTNSIGNSDVSRQSFTATTASGLRTLSGGQLSIQVEGLLAIETNAAPPLTMQDTHAIRDIFANLGTAPTGGPVQLRINRDGQPYCDLTVPVGSTVSNVVDGFALGPLSAKALIGLDIVSVNQRSDAVPGGDLTVTIRL